jgi:DNA-binding winged helix-turn-helix (wHTH) protein
MSETRPPSPPFTRESAIRKVRAGENSWNTCDPNRVCLGYSRESWWRNRSEFFVARLPIIESCEQSVPAGRYNSSMITRRPTPASVEATLEFGRFRVLLRRRQLLSDGYPVELGTRAFDLLLVLLEADGSLVTKGELMNRVWPGIVVTEGNLKAQVSALRRTFGQDRDFIRTEFGRGYRFVAVVQSTAIKTGDIALALHW